MGKKKENNTIKVRDIKSITLDVELCVPKEDFDELLRKMAFLQKGEEPSKEESDNKDEKKE